jgi:hypothetical protein
MAVQVVLLLVFRAVEGEFEKSPRMVVVLLPMTRTMSKQNASNTRLGFARGSNGRLGVAHALLAHVAVSRKRTALDGHLHHGSHEARALAPTGWNVVHERKFVSLRTEFTLNSTKQ